MKTKILLIFGFLCSFFYMNQANAQTFGLDGVQYQLRYNTDSCWYDVYLVVTAGAASTQQERIQFNSQLTLVVPTGTVVTIPRGYMPLVNNQSGTGTPGAAFTTPTAPYYAPNYWSLSSTISNPCAAPGKDFRSITPAIPGPGTAYYNNLNQGDEVKLFSVRTTPYVNCTQDVRLFINGVDPNSSACGMGGNDFSNEYTIENAANQIYQGNAAQVYPPVPFIDPDPVIGCGNGIEIDMTTATSSCQGPLTYQWAGPAGYNLTGEDVLITPATTANEGTYTVTVTDNMGCTATLAVQAFTKPNAGADQTVCAGNSVAVAGTSPTSGTWETIVGSSPPGATVNPGPGGTASISFSNTASGTYFFRYYTVLCSDTMRVIVNPKPIVSLGTPIICANLTTTLNSNQTGTWSSCNTSIATVVGNVVTGVSAGLSCFTFTNSTTGCQSTTPNLVVNPEPTVTQTTDSICIGSTANLTPISGGTWTSTNTAVATVTPAGVVSGLTAGRTKLVFREALSPNCISDTLIVDVLARPITTITGPNPICIGGTTNLTPATGGTWNATNNTIATINNTGLVTGVAAGSTTFVFTQLATGCISNPSLPVTVQASPVVSGVPNTPRCIDITIQLSPPSGGTWVSNNTAVATINAATGLVTTVGQGTVNFTFTNGAGCSATTTNLVVSPRPTVSVTGPQPICVGTSTTIAPNPTTGAGTWANLTPTIISRSGVNVTGVAAGQGKLVYTETATTCKSDTLRITVNPRPIITLFGNDSICVGGTTTFTTTAGAGSWVALTPSVASISNAGLVTGISPGFSSFTFQSATTGCTSNPSLPITVLPTPSVSISGLSTICVGNTTVLSVTPVTPGVWSSNGPGVATIDAVTGVVTGVSAGFTTFKFTDTSIGCPSPNSGPVTVIATPVATITKNTLCIGETTTVAPGSGGVWSSSNNTIATVTNAGLVTALTAGTVSFTWTASGTNCPSNPVTATISAKPVVTNPLDSELCIGETTSVTPTTGGVWSSSNASVATITNAGVITAIAAGSAEFTYTNGQGCASDATGAVVVNAPPTLTHPTPFRLCIGQTLTLSANTTGTWSSSSIAIATVNATTGLVTAVAAGTTSFSFVSTAGCPASIPTLLTVNPKPVVSFTGVPTICVGKTIQLNPTTGGSWTSSSNAIATISNTGLATGQGAGTVTFTFINTSTGCPSDASGPLTVSAGPSITAPAAPQICIGATTTIATVPANASGTWASNAPTIASITNAGLITGLAAGVATFTFTDALGCKSQPSSSVTVVAKPTITLTGGQNICIGNTTSFIANTTGSWASSNNAIATVNASGVVTGVSAGTVTITFTSTLGCISDPSVPITVGSAPIVGITGDTVLCIGNKSQLSPAVGGTWASNNPAVASVTNDGIVTSIAPGFVTFTFTEAGGGCSSAAATDTIDVISCIDPDFNVTYVNIPVPGNVKTNDNVPALTTYGPLATLTGSPAGSTPTITINPDGTYTFTGNVVGVYTYLVPVCIPPKITGCDLSLLTITVLDNTDPTKKPVANVDFATTNIGVPVTLNTMSNDRCVVTTDCTLSPASVTVIDNPSNGTYTVNAGNGNITYSPNPGFSGMDTLTYTVCVTGEPANCAQALQIITVAAPVKLNSTVAVDDFTTTPENVTVTGNVKTNDSDPEGDIQTVVPQITPLAAGTLTLLSDGSYTFVPSPLFFGPVDFPYTTCDNNPNQVCANATLHILVVPDMFVKVRVYLEGSLMNTGTTSSPDGRPMMRDNLRSSPFNGTRAIPNKDPGKYVVTVVPANGSTLALEYDLTGKFVEVAAGLLTKYDSIKNPSTVFAVTGQNAIVDWVFVELRNAATNTTIVSNRAALLQRDGDVVDVDGINPLKFPGMKFDNYYIVVKHRNHLSTMTKFAQTPAQYTDLVDFTKPTLQTYDKGLVGAYDYSGLGQKSNVRFGFNAMWAGDFDGNGKIKADNPNDDLNFLFNDVFSYPTNSTGNVNFDFAYGYLPGDFDMNGKSKFDNPNDDKNMLFGQMLFYPLNTGLLSNFDFFVEQLP